MLAMLVIYCAVILLIALMVLFFSLSFLYMEDKGRREEGFYENKLC